MNLIDDAVKSGKSALNEHEAKRFLAGFGVPVSRETLVPDEAGGGFRGARQPGDPGPR